RLWSQGCQYEKDGVNITARRGGKLYLASRDLEKAERAREDIINQTNNSNVFVKKLDLASFESIHKFVKEFKENETELHILINNAGVAMIPERRITSDGLELHIGINHFGHFLLTNLLMEMIKNSAPARIITVSSLGHFLGTIDREDLQMEQSYFKWSAYFQSKLANILFTRELAKRLRGTNVTANSLHPGIVDTHIYDGFTDIDLIFFPKIIRKTPKSGAQTSIMLAVDPGVANVSGKYFSDCAIAIESIEAQNDELATWLWKESERITKSSF
ncbi:Retinol dehydrogenase 11, partial [Pseudolycoriella hygida]